MEMDVEGVVAALRKRGSKRNRERMARYAIVAENARLDRRPDNLFGFLPTDSPKPFSPDSGTEKICVNLRNLWRKKSLQFFREESSELGLCAASADGTAR